MSQGLFQKLTGEVTDDSLPRFYPEDARLTKGSILLLEPGHPANPVVGLSSLLPIPNIAGVPAALVTGTSAAAQAGRVYIGAAATTASKALYERSTKGGIHGIVSQNTALFTTDNSHGAAVEFDFSAHPVLAYMKANPTHTYYVSFWGRVTRACAGAVGGANPTAGANMSGYSGTNDYFFVQQVGRNLPTESLPTRLNRMRPNPTNDLALNGVAAGPFRRASGFSAHTGTLANIQLAKAAAWGRSQNGVNVYNFNYPSYIFYALHIIDCTVSGQTLADADAADLTEFIKQVETPGGRYYGDTFTDPATLP